MDGLPLSTDRQAETGILLIEDYAGLGDLLKRYLLTAGYQNVDHVHTARNGERMIETLERGNYPVRLAIIDMALDPRDTYGNGVEAALVFVRRWPGLRVGIISGYMVEAALPAGIPFLGKPFNRQEFLAWVAGLLSLAPWVPPGGNHA